MSAWRETIERARVWIECGADLSSELLRSKPEVLAALAALTAQIEELEASAFVRDAWRTRAEAAEQKVEELEAALREIRDNAYKDGRYYRIARAALAQSDPPEDSE